MRVLITEAGREITRLKKEKKDLEVDQFRREKKLEKIIHSGGEPEGAKQLLDAQKESEVLAEKIRKQLEKQARVSESRD